MKTTKQQTKQTTEWDEVLQKKFGGNFVKEEEVKEDEAKKRNPEDDEKGRNERGDFRTRARR